MVKEYTYWILAEGSDLPKECPTHGINQSNGEVQEYTYWILAEGSDLPKECPTHGINQSNGEVQEYTYWILAEGSDLPKECPTHCINQSYGEFQIKQEPWGTRSTLSLPLFLGQLWPGVVLPVRVYLWVN